MKKILLSFISLCLFIVTLSAGNVEKTYSFGNYAIQARGAYTTISFDQALLSGLPGEPMLPYQQVALLLPPGEKALSVEIIPSEETEIPGMFVLYPQQPVRPVSEGPSNEFLKNAKVYAMNAKYPADPAGRLMTQYLNGYAFALSSFTPLTYNPATGRVTYFRKVTVRITTQTATKPSATLRNLSSDATVTRRVKNFAQNPEMIDLYPEASLKHSNYQMLIITPQVYQSGFSDLINYYGTVGLEARVATIESIYSQGNGIDNQDMIRNWIIQEYQNSGIQYVLLGGGVGWIPYRGFYCFVESGSGYTDTDIPADLYYSGLDGNFDANGNLIYGQPDDEPDLLPDVAVGRFVFDNAQELAAMVHKTVSYQDSPVTGEMKRPLMAGEFLTDSPPTWGGDYLDLMINDHRDNGYFTHGIPSATNTVDKLYDSPLYTWPTDTIIAKFNQGRSFVHHLGHASTDYMLRLTSYDITNENFYLVDGVHHNYALLYTQGCYCGAFDLAGCIAVKSVAIDNFLVAGIFNSRYGWFDQGLTEGPSEHLEREFVSAMYTDTIPEKHIGATHMISKIKTAPWVTVPGEFEPGAQRWCHYCCNLLGDPALSVWTDEPIVGMGEKKTAAGVIIYPNPARDKVFVRCALASSSDVKITVLDLFGKTVTSPVEYPSQSRGEHSFTVTLPGLPSGVYLVKVETEASSRTYKLTILE